MTMIIALLSLQSLFGLLRYLHPSLSQGQLRRTRELHRELQLRTSRGIVYALLLIALAWWQWHGSWALLIAAALAADAWITFAVAAVEHRSGRRSHSIAVLQTLSVIGFGALLALLVPYLYDWWLRLSALVAVGYGYGSWLLTACAAGTAGLALWDAIALAQLRRPPVWQREPIRIGRKPAPRTVLVAGATGFVGRALVRRLIGDGEYVIVLVRDAARAGELFGPQVRIFTEPGQIAATSRIDVVVNLAGAPLFAGRWTRRRQSELLDSRLTTTEGLTALCRRLQRSPSLLINASAVGYYGGAGGTLLDESGPAGRAFQSTLGRDWEAAAAGARALGVRTVVLRMGLVLGRDGGALPLLAGAVRCCIGAVLGGGRQWLSWIHCEDLMAAIRLIIENPQIDGAVNATAPQPIMQRDFMRSLARQLHRPLWLRVPGRLLRLAFGDMASAWLEGRRVAPRRLEAAGLVFRYARVEDALADLYRDRRSLPSALEVYYNGACPVCRAELAGYRLIAERCDAPLAFIDVSRHERALARWGLGFAQAERRLYVLQGDRLVSGIDAFVLVWAALPGYRWLARLVGLPGLHGLCTLTYDCVLSPGLVRWNHARQRRQCPQRRARLARRSCSTTGDPGRV